MLVLLQIEDLDVSFRNDEGEITSAARDVNLTLDRGEVLGLVGESGSGKSSVAMSIPRLLPSPPAFWPKGRVLFDGQDMLKMPVADLRRIRGSRIGVVFQDPIGSLSPLHRIGDQLVETVLLHRDVSAAAAREQALEWLGKVGIPDPAVRAQAYPHELSGGMQQRVMIAMGLMLDPDLLIADEPTTALDVTIQAQVLRLLKNLHRSNSAVLLITHDLGVVSQLATRLAVMRRGEVVETSDNPEDFFNNPKHPYSRTLVGEARRMELT
ncbi:MAG: ABC transporter ATP-binding protein [Kiritimatiellae bacterium]|nr:ABC transporter ATP-binding protein [Kiritimatiellia bacterium]